MIQHEHPVAQIDFRIFPFHHSAKRPGYVNRKPGTTAFYPYKGRYGIGYVRYRTCYDSPATMFVDYFIAPPVTR